jgi:hypothetical protein
MTEEAAEKLDQRIENLNRLVSQGEQSGDLSSSEAAALRAYNDSLREEIGMDKRFERFYLKLVFATNKLKRRGLQAAWIDSIVALRSRPGLFPHWYKAKDCAVVLKKLTKTYGEEPVRRFLVTKLERDIAVLEALSRLPKGTPYQHSHHAWSQFERTATATDLETEFNAAFEPPKGRGTDA